MNSLSLALSKSGPRNEPGPQNLATTASPTHKSVYLTGDASSVAVGFGSGLAMRCSTLNGSEILYIDCTNVHFRNSSWTDTLGIVGGNVTVNIAGTNDAPVAANDTGSVLAGSVLTQTADRYRTLFRVVDYVPQLIWSVGITGGSLRWPTFPRETKTSMP